MLTDINKVRHTKIHAAVPPVPEPIGSDTQLPTKKFGSI
jgi:hypothetical protein